MKKLVAITGASSGIGKAIASLFSQQGYPLLLVARRLDQLEALNLPNTLCKQVDITDQLAFKKAILQAENLFGPTDALINNAGLMLLGSISNQSIKEWHDMFNVNVLAMMNCIQVVLTGMQARKTGSIINMSSIAGRKTFANHAAYCGSKFAVHALSENLREEVSQDNVRIMTIAPGAVETPLLSHTTSEEIKENYTQWKKSMGGALDANVVANAVLFAYQQPQQVCFREMVLAATKQAP